MEETDKEWGHANLMNTSDFFHFLYPSCKWTFFFSFFLLIYRLWDLGQQRCVHSYAVHTDSVWALASNPSFSHVYSGGRDLSVSPVLLPTTSIRPLVCGVWTPLSCWSFDALFCLYSQLYLTDLATRESILLCTKEHPILRLASHDDGIWVATTDSSVHKWPVEGHNPQKVFQRGGSFVSLSG